jgi:hypothetical protein
MEGLHCLLDGGVVVESVALKQIDVVEPESLERGIDGREDVLRIAKAESSTSTSVKGRK